MPSGTIRLDGREADHPAKHYNRRKRNYLFDIYRYDFANGAVLQVDDAAFTFRDDDDVGLVRMIEDEVAGSRTSKKVTYPRFRLG